MILLKLKNPTITATQGFQVSGQKQSEVSDPYCAMVYICTIGILLKRRHVLRLVPLMVWRHTCGRLVDGWWSAYVLPRLTG